MHIIYLQNTTIYVVERVFFYLYTAKENSEKRFETHLTYNYPERLLIKSTLRYFAGDHYSTQLTCALKVFVKSFKSLRMLLKLQAKATKEFLGTL